MLMPNFQNKMVLTEAQSLENLKLRDPQNCMELVFVTMMENYNERERW